MTSAAANVEALPASDADDHSELLIGERLRACRRRQALSLRVLAERSKLSIGMLSQIERGVSLPSLKTLSRLRAALGVPLSELLSEQTPSREPIILRAEAARRLEFPNHGFQKHIVSPASARQIEMMVIEMNPGGGSGPEPYAHEGEECGYVLQGLLSLTVAGQSYELAEGDTFQFPSSIPHQFENRSAEAARVLWIVTPPFYGRRV